MTFKTFFCLEVNEINKIEVTNHRIFRDRLYVFESNIYTPNAKEEKLEVKSVKR